MNKPISHYEIGMVANRAILKIGKEDHSVLVRVLKKETIYRFMPVVIKEDEKTNCWIVLTGCLSHAYPKISHKGKKIKLSRLVFEEFKGISPKGKMVLHKCDNPRCINPEHLYLGTAADNARDLKDRGKGTNSSIDKKKPKKIKSPQGVQRPWDRFLKKINNKY